MDAFSNPMQNLFHIKRLSFRHQRYCFHKGVFFPQSLWRKKCNHYILSVTQKENSELLYVQLELFSLQALIMFWKPHHPVKSLQEGLAVGTPARQATLRAFPRGYSTATVAIVILSCWATCCLEGGQMRTAVGSRAE